MRDRVKVTAVEVLLRHGRLVDARQALVHLPGAAHSVALCARRRRRRRRSRRWRCSTRWCREQPLPSIARYALLGRVLARRSVDVPAVHLVPAARRGGPAPAARDAVPRSSPGPTSRRRRDRGGPAATRPVSPTCGCSTTPRVRGRVPVSAIARCCAWVKRSTPVGPTPPSSTPTRTSRRSGSATASARSAAASPEPRPPSSSPLVALLTEERLELGGEILATGNRLFLVVLLLEAAARSRRPGGRRPRYPRFTCSCQSRPSMTICS